MTYYIRKTDGSVLTTLTEKELDEQYSMYLIGYPDSVMNGGDNNVRYHDAEIINGNFIRLLENSADYSAPSNPIEGQLWFSKFDKILKYFDGNGWVELTAISEGYSKLPLFTPIGYKSNPNSLSFVNSKNFDWLYSSQYIGAYNYLIAQFKPTGKFDIGTTFYTIMFSDGDLQVTDVLITTGTLQDLRDWCSERGYIATGSTIRDLVVLKVLPSSTETVKDISITYYETYDHKKIITPAQEVNAVAIFNKTNSADYYIVDITNERFKLPRENVYDVVIDNEGNLSLAKEETTYYYLGTSDVDDTAKIAAMKVEVISKKLDDDLGNISSAGEQVIREIAGSNVGGVGGKMFDVVQKDHLLTFNESKGLALLGTYVYKESLLGSRYGYPIFYNTCLSEYNNSIDGGYLSSNIEKVGSLTDTSGVLSGFSTSKYAIVSNAVTGTFSPGNNAWEICLKITTGNDVSTLQDYFNFKDVHLGPVELFIQGAKFKISLSSNGTSANIADASTGTYTVLINTTYWTKITFNGTDYIFSYSLDGENFTDDITVTNSTVVLSGKIPTLGIDYDTSYANPFLGSIDLTQCYIKIAGEYWWKGTRQVKVHDNGHMYYDIADRSLVDALYDETGIAWMYGIDIENERIFLPRNDYMARGEKGVVGNGQTLGLTDGTNDYGMNLNGNYSSVLRGMMVTSTSGAVGTTATVTTNATQNILGGITTDPTKSGIELVKAGADKYIYMIVGSTDEKITYTTFVEVTEPPGALADPDIFYYILED